MMLREIKPRTARSKRAVEKREPKATENAKSTLFLRGSKTSQAVQDALADLYALRAPLAKKFSRRNPIRPFEDPSSLEFFSAKNDTALLVLGASTKKRPHTLTIARTFGHRLLDMLELHLDPGTHMPMPRFRGAKPAVGLRPMLLFVGPAFDSPVTNEYTLAKSLLIDLFKGETTDQIDVEALRYVLMFTVDHDHDPAASSDVKPPIRLRAYTVRTRRSGQKLPRVEVDEMGPRMDLRVGRMREPDASVLKESLKRPRGTEERTKKNIVTDPVGDKMGKIHVGKQDLFKLQTRKMKGLKRARGDGDLVEGKVDNDELKKRKI